MLRTCITCQQPTILGRHVDNHLIVIDAEPSADGTAYLTDDPADKPTVVFGVETDADFEYYGLTRDAPRYRRHNCDKEN